MEGPRRGPGRRLEIINGFNLTARLNHVDEAREVVIYSVLYYQGFYTFQKVLLRDVDSNEYLIASYNYVVPAVTLGGNCGG